ncbi:MAG TPA: PIG-L family deacetylase [Ktedonobacteraceae bacterium]
MRQLQQLSPRQFLLRESYGNHLKERSGQHEAVLLAEILERNGREDRVSTATPPGYCYEREDALPSFAVDAGGPIMQVAAHPGDGPDFFYATYLKMATHTPYRANYHEVLLTDGEGGVDGWHPERTRQVRIEEAYAGAEIIGSRLHFLGYPDGSLSALEDRERTRLVARLAQKIGDIQPAMLVVHPPKNDHPDHAYSFLLTLAALQLNAQEGGRVPTLLMHDVEFGLQQKSLWLPRVIDPFTHTYPMHVPGLIVDISTTHHLAQHALQKHQTQMYDPVTGQPKAYADLIDTLARVRGWQFAPEETTQTPWGQGFSHVVIPGVTNEQNILPFGLSAGSCYRLVKKDG